MHQLQERFALWGSIGGKTVQLVQSIGPVLLTGFQVKLAIADAGNLLGEVLACFAFFERLLGTFGVGNVQITSQHRYGLAVFVTLNTKKGTYVANLSVLADDAVLNDRFFAGLDALAA